MHIQLFDAITSRKPYLFRFLLKTAIFSLIAANFVFTNLVILIVELVILLLLFVFVLVDPYIESIPYTVPIQ